MVIRTRLGCVLISVTVGQDKWPENEFKLYTVL